VEEPVKDAVDFAEMAALPINGVVLAMRGKGCLAIDTAGLPAKSGPS
jgi:hypothetical protein